jgi:hypothetical protein
LLVERVAGSALFQRSRRLRDFLLFVCERGLTDPQNAVGEHEIGTRVFGRPPDFMVSEDTLVRVHASRLRKRLEQYFATEGAAEPVVIEIPTHSYMPVFRTRDAGPSGVAALAIPGPVAPAEPKAAPVASNSARVANRRAPVGTGQRRVALVGSAMVLVLVLCSTCLYLDNRGLRRLLGAGLERRPTVDRLWKQMFGNGRPAYLVLGDSNLTMLEYVLRRQISLLEYRQKQFPVPKGMVCDPAASEVVSQLMSLQFTSIADASLTRHVGLLNAVHGVPTYVISPQDADPQDFKSSNAVLAGSRRSNPWLELFEDRLNFRSRFDEARRVAHLENMDPRPGEERTYKSKRGERGYCRVAYLPNLGRTGSVLILSGTEMASTEAAVDFITSERWLLEVGSALQVDTRGGFPHFEVLLRTHLVSFASPQFEMVAVRLAPD